MEINKHWYIAQGQACQIYKTCTACKQVKRRAHDFYTSSKGASRGKGNGKNNGLRTGSRCKQCENKRKYLSRKMKKPLIAKYGQVCHYCEQETEYNQLGIDHIIPVSKGGTDEEDNLVLCCNACNVAKGTMDYDEFKSQAAKNTIKI